MASRVKLRPQLHKHIESLIQLAKVCDKIRKNHKLNTLYENKLVTFFVELNEGLKKEDIQDARTEACNTFSTSSGQVKDYLKKKDTIFSSGEKREFENFSQALKAFSAFLTPENNPDAAAALIAGKALEDDQAEKDYTITEQGNGINKTIKIHNRLLPADFVNVTNGTVFINPSFFILLDATKDKIAEVAARAAKAQGWNTVTICMHNYQNNPKDLRRYLEALLKQGFPLDKIYVAEYNYDPNNPQTASSKVPITEALYTTGKKRGQLLLSDEKQQYYAKLFKSADIAYIEGAKTEINKQLKTGFLAGLPFGNLQNLYATNKDDLEKAGILHNLILQNDDVSLDKAKQLFASEQAGQQLGFSALLKQFDDADSIKSLGLFLKTFPVKDISTKFAELTDAKEKARVLKALQPEQQSRWFNRGNNVYFDACVVKLIPITDIQQNDIDAAAKVLGTLDTNQQDQALKVARQKNSDFVQQLQLQQLNMGTTPQEPSSANDLHMVL